MTASSTAWMQRDQAHSISGGPVSFRAPRGTWLLGIMALGVALRLHHLGTWGLGMDEAYSANVATRGLRDLVNFIVVDDFHPPLYYAFLHFWQMISTNEVWLRIPSVLFGALTIWVIYALGARLVDHRVGLFSAGILAISPLHIWHSQEVRMYALLFLLSTASLYFFVRVLKEGSRAVWISYITITILALYTDYGGFLILAGENLAIVALLALRYRVPWATWVGAQAVVLAAFAPWGVSLLETITRAADVLVERNITPASARQFAFTLSAFTSHFLPMGTPLLKAAVAGTFGATAIAGALMLRDRPSVAAILLATSFGALSIAALGSVITKVFFVRSLIAASAGYYILLAAATMKMRSRVFSLALMSGLVALNVYSLSEMYYRVVKAGPWRDVAAYVTSHYNTGDGIVFLGGAWHRPFEFYAAPAHIAPLAVDYGGPSDLTLVRELTRRSPRVWLVLKEDDDYDPRGRVKTYMSEWGALREQRYFWDDIRIELYQP